jgi:amino acid permease
MDNPDGMSEKLLSENNDGIPVEEKPKLSYMREKLQRFKSFYVTVSTGSTTGGVFCILCLTFGSGILALPYSIVKLGVFLGFLLFALASFCSLWTMMLLNEVAFRDGIIDYSQLISKYFGQKQVILYEIMNLISNFGAIIIYQQISKYYIEQFSFEFHPIFSPIFRSWNN